MPADRRRESAWGTAVVRAGHTHTAVPEAGRANQRAAHPCQDTDSLAGTSAAGAAARTVDLEGTSEHGPDHLSIDWGSAKVLGCGWDGTWVVSSVAHCSENNNINTDTELPGTLYNCALAWNIVNVYVPSIRSTRNRPSQPKVRRSASHSAHVLDRCCTSTAVSHPSIYSGMIIPGPKNRVFVILICTVSSATSL